MSDTIAAIATAPGPSAIGVVRLSGKAVKTNCVCSGAHCAAVGGFAALRMRRPLYGG